MESDTNESRLKISQYLNFRKRIIRMMSMKVMNSNKPIKQLNNLISSKSIIKVRIKTMTRVIYIVFDLDWFDIETKTR
jgi:wyosine [tRNA(Phe)-imidazoG37] synthetase (radical SAM superfamily)